MAQPRTAVAKAKVLTNQTKPQEWRPEHLRLAIDAACVALWSWNVDTNRFTMDERAFEMWGVPWASEVEFERLSAHIHPADRDRVRAAFLATRSVAGRYEIDFRTSWATRSAGSPPAARVRTPASWTAPCSASSWT